VTSLTSDGNSRTPSGHSRMTTELGRVECRILLMCTIRSNFTIILKIFARLFEWNVLGLSLRTWTLDLYIDRRLLIRSDPAWAFPIRTDCVTIDTVRCNWQITPDLCLATSWLHDLIYIYISSTINAVPRQSFVIHPNGGWWQSRV
jgi:hypothetical protein